MRATDKAEADHQAVQAKSAVDASQSTIVSRLWGLAIERINSGIKHVPWWLVYTLGLMPGVWYFYLGLSNQLGADPVKSLERELGVWALIFLIAGLAVTPLRQMLGLNVLRHRRAIGLLAFYYAGFHLLTYVVLDQSLEWSLIWADILKRPYITVGMVSLLLLLPLALTSNDAAIRRMGAKAWGRLHMMVYVAAALAALHFILLVKAWPLKPLMYAAAVAALLLYRVAHKAWKRRSPVRAR
jgi:methionine sulfoxide reductase heme-binding subunit